MDQQAKAVESAGDRRNTVYFLDCTDLERIEKDSKSDIMQPAIKNRPLHARIGSFKAVRVKKYEEMKFTDHGDKEPPENITYGNEGAQQQSVHMEFIGVQYRKTNVDRISEIETSMSNTVHTPMGSREQKCMMTGLDIDSIDTTDSARSSTACDISSSVFSNSKSLSCHMSEVELPTDNQDICVAISSKAQHVQLSGTRWKLPYFKDVACSADFVSSEDLEEEEYEEDDGYGECVECEDSCDHEIKSTNSSSIDACCDKEVETILNQDVMEIDTSGKVKIFQWNIDEDGENYIAVSNRKDGFDILQHSNTACLQNKPPDSIPGTVNDSPKNIIGFPIPPSSWIPTKSRTVLNKTPKNEIESTLKNNVTLEPRQKSECVGKYELGKTAVQPSIVQAVNKTTDDRDVQTSIKLRLDVSTQVVFESDSSSEEKLQASDKSDLSSPESSSDYNLNVVTPSRDDLKRTPLFHNGQSESNDDGSTDCGNKSSDLGIHEYKLNKVEANITKETNDLHDSSKFTKQSPMNMKSFDKFRRESSSKNSRVGIHGWPQSETLSISCSGKMHEKFRSKLMKSLSKSKTLCNKFARKNTEQIKNENTSDVCELKSKIRQEDQMETEPIFGVKEVTFKENVREMKGNVFSEGVANKEKIKRKRKVSPNTETSCLAPKSRTYVSNAPPFSVKMVSPNWKNCLQDKQHSRNTSLSPTRRNASKRYRHTPVYLNPSIKYKSYLHNNHHPIRKNSTTVRTVSSDNSKISKSFVERRNFVKQFSSSIREMNRGKKNQTRLDSWHNLPCHKTNFKSTEIKSKIHSPLSYRPAFIEGNNNIHIRENSGDEPKVSMASASRILSMSKTHPHTSEHVLSHDDM